MHEPLYSADEMRAAEARHPGFPDTADELMERAGAAVADEALRSFPDARRFAVVCGGGANGGDGTYRGAGPARGRSRRVGDRRPRPGPTSSIDALFGTGFHGEPRPDAAQTDRADQRVREARASRSTSRRASTPRRARSRAPRSRRDLTVTFHGAEGRARGLAGSVPRRRGRRRGHRARPAPDRDVRATAAVLAVCRDAANATRSSPRARSSSSAARPGRRGAAVLDARRPRSAPTPAT